MPAPAADDSDKVERELQRLRRLPENRVCPNCLKEDRVGFKGVCMAFKTFVCNECKSAHQSFSHRTKSVDMSVWKMEEVRALDGRHGGGNRAAQRRWLARVPEGERPTAESTLDAYKRFVQRAYIEERWAAPPGAELEGEGGDGAAAGGGDSGELSASGTSPEMPRQRRRKHHRDKDRLRALDLGSPPEGGAAAPGALGWPGGAALGPEGPGAPLGPYHHMALPGACGDVGGVPWACAAPVADLRVRARGSRETWAAAGDSAGAWGGVPSPAHSAPAGMPRSWESDAGSGAYQAAVSPASAPAGARPYGPPPLDVTNPWMPPIDPTNPWAEALLKQRVAAVVGGRERMFG